MMTSGTSFRDHVRKHKLTRTGKAHHFLSRRTVLSDLDTRTCTLRLVQAALRLSSVKRFSKAPHREHGEGCGLEVRWCSVSEERIFRCPRGNTRRKGKLN